MKTIIFDIDGTLTNMWPIEKSVLLYMTNRIYKNKIENLKKSGISDTYKIFLKISGNKLGKKNYTTLYNQTFLKLNNLPKLKSYSTVAWIKKNKNKYIFLYATGGQKLETEYVLTRLGLIKYFDLKNSINKDNCRFSKKTGIPFKIIKRKYKDCFLVTDSQSDCDGAKLAKIPYYQIKLGQKLEKTFKT